MARQSTAQIVQQRKSLIRAIRAQEKQVDSSLEQLERYLYNLLRMKKGLPQLSDIDTMIEMARDADKKMNLLVDKIAATAASFRIL